MRFAAVSTVPGLSSFACHQSSLFPVPPAPVCSAPAPATVSRASKIDRRLVLGSVLAILALLDVNIILWTLPSVTQIAEWCGVSLTHSLWIGIITMLVMVPVAIAVTVFAWRRIAR